MAAVTLDSNTFFSLAGTGVSSGSNTLFYHTCSGTDRFLIVSVITTSAGAPTDPSYVYYNNVGMTLANTVTNGGAYIRTYYMMNPSSGNNTVIVRWAASTTRGGILATSFNNISQSSVPPFLQLVANSSSSQSITSYTGYKVFDVIVVTSGDTSTATVGANQTQLSNFIGSAGAGGNAARIASSIEDGNTSSNSVMSWTTSGGSVVHTSISLLSTDPILFNVSSNNTIYANSSNVVLAGAALETGSSIRLSYANQDLNITTYTANATQPYFTSPSLANVFSSRIQFISSANLQIVNSTNSIIASKIVTFIPSPIEKLIHNVTDISQASNTGSIYYNQLPAITVGEQIIYDTRTAASYNVFIDDKGYIVVDSLNTDTTDSFNYRIYESSSQTWGGEGTITFIGGVVTYISRNIKMYVRVV